MASCGLRVLALCYALVAASDLTFRDAGAQAAASIFAVFYAGNGTWRDCAAPSCRAGNQDWGADSLDYVTWLAWTTTHDETLRPVVSALVRSAAVYPNPCTALPCGSWSDVPLWDAIADMREYEIVHDPEALSKARRAFAFVDGASVFSMGACPDVHYQQAAGAINRLKTLETDANYIKAALLLYDATRERRYLDAALHEYEAVRARFRDPSLPLYTVYVFDDGHACVQLPHRFFASVNGDMIWNGIALARLTGRRAFLEQAVATARAVDAHLSDGRGIFTDLQAENDIVEPLVEAMWLLADRQAFARSWIVRNAAAALGARKADGTFGRFFDGPPPQNVLTVWQSNGAAALEIAAASIASETLAVASNDWAGARFISRAITSMPATIVFDGSAIALIGAIGDRCCEPGHARVFIDGRETDDGTGIWQNKSSSGKTLPGSVLFAWQWPHRARHSIRIESAGANAKEGGPFIDVSGYFVK